MKSAILFLSAFALLCGCNTGRFRSEYFREIEFFYFNNSPEAFSLKLIGQDSVFIKQYVSSDLKGGLKDGITYFSILKSDLKQQLDSLVAIIDLGSLDSLYEADQIDGDEYKLYFESGTITRQISIHDRNAPKELEHLKNLFLKMKSSLAFIPFDAIINFRENPPEPKLIKQNGSP